MFVSICFWCICLFLVVIKKRLKIQSGCRNIPFIPGSLPVVGLAHKVFMKDSKEVWIFFKQLNKVTNDLGGVAKLYLGPDLYFVITDPSVNNTILNTVLEKPSVYKIATPWLGRGLVTADVPTWQRHRKLLNSAFNQHVLDTFLEDFNNESVKLADKLKVTVGKGEFNIFPYLREASLNAICDTALGKLDREEIIASSTYTYYVEKILSIFMKRFQSIWMHSNLLFYWTSLYKEQQKIVRLLKKISAQILQIKRTSLNTNHKNASPTSRKRFKSFMDILLEMQEDDSFTDVEISDEVDTMIGAGFDTSSSALLVILLLVGSHPKVQEDVYKEIKAVCDLSKESLTNLDLSQLPYLEAVIKETLRMYPIAPVIARRCHRDVYVDKYLFPKGANIIIGIFGTHYHECWGEDADEFNPERWLEPSRIPKNPSAYFAFSHGRRSCIGKPYAMRFLKTMLVHILHRYKITSVLNRVEFKVDVLLNPASGFEVSLEYR